MRRNIISIAEEAVRRRVSKVREPLHARLDRLRERYCEHRGGHDWSDWELGNGDFSYDWARLQEVRMCMRCKATQSREVRE